MSKIHALPNSKHWNTEEDKAQKAPMNSESQKPHGSQQAKGVLNNNKVKNPFHCLKIMV